MDITLLRPINYRVQGSNLDAHVWYESVDKPGIFVYRDAENYIWLDVRSATVSYEKLGVARAVPTGEFVKCDKGTEFKIKV